MNHVLKLRPHHVLDIIRNYGHFGKFTPHHYGHAQHLVSQKLVSDLNTPIQLIIGSDDICNPCIHLLPNGMCDDVLHQLEEPVSKQEYNDSLEEIKIRLANHEFPFSGITKSGTAEFHFEKPACFMQG